MGRTLALVQGVLLVALIWPKAAADGTDASAYIPADWGAGIALALLYAAVMLGTMALWARRWKVVPPAPAEAEANPSWMRGPYRFLRHPMRLSILAGAIAWCLIYRSPGNLVILAVLAAVVVLDARRADAALAAGGGPLVREWLGRVRAFVPGLY